MILYGCRKVSLMVSRGELEGAGFAARLLVRLHLLICKHCRLYLKQIRLISKAALHWAGQFAGIDNQDAFKKQLLAKLLKTEGA